MYENHGFDSYHIYAYLFERIEGEFMEELTKLLNNVQGSYYDFVVAMLHYAKKKKSRLVVLTEFIKKNKDITTSDIIEYVSSQPDFYEDAAYTKNF